MHTGHSHAQALLTSTPEGQTDYIQADLRDTDTILKGAAHALDLTRPVAVLLIAVLHFIPDADDPYAVVARLMDAVPSGSYLVMAHAASDIASEASAEMARRYNAMSSASITRRTRLGLRRATAAGQQNRGGAQPDSRRPGRGHPPAAAHDASQQRRGHPGRDRKCPRCAHRLIVPPAHAAGNADQAPVQRRRRRTPELRSD